MAEPKRKRRPPLSDEEREMELINLAFDFSREQFLKGTATSQLATHFLKLGSRRAKLEEEKLRRESLLLEARVEELKSAAFREEAYKDVLKALALYQGRTSETEADDDDGEDL